MASASDTSRKALLGNIFANTTEFIEIAEKASNSAVSGAISASAIQTCPKSEMLPKKKEAWKNGRMERIPQLSPFVCENVMTVVKFSLSIAEDVEYSVN